MIILVTEVKGLVQEIKTFLLIEVTETSGRVSWEKESLLSNRKKETVRMHLNIGWTKLYFFRKYKFNYLSIDFNISVSR